MIKRFFRRLFADDRGLSGVEWTVVCAVVGTAVVAAIQLLSPSVGAHGDDARRALMGESVDPRLGAGGPVSVGGGDSGAGGGSVLPAGFQPVVDAGKWVGQAAQGLVAAPALLVEEMSTTKGVIDFFLGGFLGDAYEDVGGEKHSLASVAGQIAFGFVPVLGQMADARDVIWAIKDLVDGDPSNNKEAGVNLTFALIGFVPGVGDLAKQANKASRLAKAEKASEAAIATFEAAKGASTKYADIARAAEGTPAAADAAAAAKRAAEQRVLRAREASEVLGAELEIVNGTEDLGKVFTGKNMKNLENGSRVVRLTHKLKNVDHADAITKVKDAVDLGETANEDRKQ